MANKPPVSDELVAWLKNVAFPPLEAHPDTDNSNKLWFEAGIQHVVRRMQRWNSQQQANNSME